MKTGLGDGSIGSGPAGIACGGDCDESFPASVTSVSLAAAPLAGSVFVRWEGDATGTANPITVPLGANRVVRAVFDSTTPIPAMTGFKPGEISTYLTANPAVTTPAQFLKALPVPFKQNWILMTRSESLQTGTARHPRVILSSADARVVFTVALAEHTSYPGAHPSAVEYMQWDADEKNFRFHEIVLNPITTGPFPRPRGISIDDKKCSKCHSTRNVLNTSAFPGTSGDPVGSVKVKNKPNWDAYDSWAGAMPFNRDRIYQNSVEEAAFRNLLNLWNWRNSAANDSVRQFIEQLELQPPHVSTTSPHRIIRNINATTDNPHIQFGYDFLPTLATTPDTASYSFDGPSTAPSSINRGGRYVTLRHSNPNPTPNNDDYSNPVSDEGRAVQLFDLLGGLDGDLNAQRIADELINHHFATGSIGIDVRAVAYAILKEFLTIDVTGNTVVSTPMHTITLGFFNARHGLATGQGINEVFNDTRQREESLPRRKADFQKRNFDRSADSYLFSTAPANGLFQEYASSTTITVPVIRQEVFRRPNDLGLPDVVIGGKYVDREFYSRQTAKVALFRYFLEPLGVSVDKWSMGVRGRSRTYTFADVFDSYVDELSGTLRASLVASGITNPDDPAQLIPKVNSALGSLPGAADVPTFTDVQRIFNKSCIECHGGLGYPPYGPGSLDLSEDETASGTTPPNPRLARSYQNASSRVSVSGGNPAGPLWTKINLTSEACPGGLMPCGGPRLSQVDIETIRRWILGGEPATVGDPHVKTVNGINYDFQAAGEFILLRDEYVEIQARQTAVDTGSPLGPQPHTELTSCVSINTAVAIRIGSSRITLQPNLNGRPDPEGLQLRVNGKTVQLGAAGFPLPDGARIMRTTAPGGIQVEAPGGAVIVVTPGWWDHFQVWYLNIDARHLRATRGIMGAITKGNWLPALPDGTQMGPRPIALAQRFQDLYGKFGQAWRVTDANSLFDYAPGTSTKSFTIENWPGGDPASPCKVPPLANGITNKPPQTQLTFEQAQECCTGIVDPDKKAHCVHDVMVTGECGFGKTYRLADQITRNAAPAPPALVFPADFATNMAGPIKFSWTHASDPDGDTVTYKHHVWREDQQPNNNSGVLITMQNSTTGMPGPGAPPAIPGGVPNRSVVLLVGLLLLIVLILLALKKQLGLLTALAILILLAAIVLYVRREGTPASVQTQSQAEAPIVSQAFVYTIAKLDSGKAYYWKVIAEDGKGGVTESEVRRFEVK